MEIKRLSWLHDYQYESLPKEYKDLKNEFNTLNTSLKRKSRRLDKIVEEMNGLKRDIKIEFQQHNQLHSRLQFINKKYTPKSYLQTYSKNGKGEYLQVIIKYLNTTKTIYLGSKKKVIDSLSNYIPNLNDKNYNLKIGDFISPVIMEHFIKLSNPKEFLSITYKMKDILEVLKKGEK